MRQLGSILVVCLAHSAACDAGTATQAAAVEFLLRHRPVHDAHVDVHAHAELALQAREALPWATEAPWPIFCEAVLPYACLDEPRQDWRPLLHERCLPLVAHARTASEVVLALNGGMWEKLGVRYEPNLSPTFMAPLDVLASGRASCTGLSLLLVAACRSVGVPARVAGVGDWGEAFGGGNHVWVEVWVDGGWHHLGAAESSPLDQTWFDVRLHPADGPRVYASTYRRDEPTDPAVDDEPVRFPLPWRDELEASLDAPADGIGVVPAVEVTARYRRRSDL